MSSEDMSGKVRRMLAATLGGIARGLSASARMVEQVSWILRPREPAEGGRASEAVGEAVGGRGAGDETMGPVGAADAAEGMEPDATDVMEPGGAGIEAPEAPPEATGPVEPAGATEPAEAASDEPPVTEAEPAPEPVPTESAPEGPDRIRVAESHIAALADRPVADVVSEIAGLSTDELEDLYAYEVTHKNRKTVLRAIERAVTPSSS